MVQRLLFSLPLCFVLSLSYACPVAVGTLSRVLYDGFFYLPSRLGSIPGGLSLRLRMPCPSSKKGAPHFFG
ncbi:hypothetical protein M438DRAFT_349725 [Aureobasidium pullulans EXF-150]|uniref:Secreted protein n=1 Tax=Aureobasidium pullulans EXF-150 TaxID=1043002 RepID=A0A074X1X6_AURPU|nr:uncharacterized protein M438DRAFT_349725 [Aureobasidium pullulans EXF-150]KEQ79413.1 hypothetical protein M438DRAFT_349725 [Aureobasidium pullulans EXF-150]